MAPPQAVRQYTGMTKRVTIRDPLWDTIRLDPTALRIVDTPAFQRLRYIKQLGHAHLVYPGATHTRFDHAIGVYHLARRAMRVLRQRGDLARVDPLDCTLIPLAALLHDIGHYPYSHALEELEDGRIPGHHEALVTRFLAQPELADVLHEIAPDAALRVERLIRGESLSPLQGLVSGSLDLDKIEYLKRDAFFCGVPYGEVDVDRLLHGLTVLADPASGRLELGVSEKAVAALESLLFAKYQMFRNVYWHHAVRAATVMYKRVVADALVAGIITGEQLVGATDEALLYLLDSRAMQVEHATSVRDVVQGLHARRLPKRAAELTELEPELAERAEWLARDSGAKRAAEDSIAAELGLPPAHAYLDYPEKRAMFGLDLLVELQDGTVTRLGPRGRRGLIGLPAIADVLYRSARVLRLFVRRAPMAAGGAFPDAGAAEAALRAAALGGP